MSDNNHDPDDHIKDIAAAIFKIVEGKMSTDAYIFVDALWIGAEPTDSNLSEVEIQGMDETVRGVRKLAHVIDLNSGDPILCVQGPTCPLTIIGEMRGDIASFDPETSP